MQTYLTPDDIADRLEYKRRSGSGWIARCPIHDDRLPSLKISTGNKGTVLYCHAGCRTEDVLATINVEPRMLFYDYTGQGSAHHDIMSDLHALIARNGTVDLWMPETLGDVMREAFHQGNPKLGVVEWCRAYVEWGWLMDLPFDPDHVAEWEDEKGDWIERGAFRYWHIVADGPVYTYMQDWLETSQRRWDDVRAEAMTVLFRYWRRRTQQR